MKPEEWLCVDGNKPLYPNYSILKMLGDDCKDDKGKFEFKIIWPEKERPNYNIWRQSTNPVTEKVKVKGYEAVDVNFAGHYWGGLENGALQANLDYAESDHSVKQLALLDGSVDHGISRPCSRYICLIHLNTRTSPAPPTTKDIGSSRSGP